MSESTRNGILGLVERVADAGQSLSFVVSLVSAVEGVNLRVGSLKGLVYIECESFRAFVGFVRQKHSQFPALARTLSTAGTTAEVRVDGRTVAVLGAGVTPGPFARRLGYGRTRLRLGAVVGTLVRSPLRWYRRRGSRLPTDSRRPQGWLERQTRRDAAGRTDGETESERVRRRDRE